MCVYTMVNVFCEKRNHRICRRMETTRCWHGDTDDRPDGWVCTDNQRTRGVPKTKTEFQTRGCTLCVLTEVDSLRRSVEMQMQNNVAGVQDAGVQDADVQDANGQDANGQDAIGQDANVQDAEVQDADIQNANVQDTDVQDGEGKKRVRKSSSDSEGSDSPDAKKGKQE